MPESLVLPHFYAHDSQLYLNFKADSQTFKLAINTIEICCDNVISWMCANLLKLNHMTLEN